MWIQLPFSAVFQNDFSSQQVVSIWNIFSGVVLLRKHWIFPPLTVYLRASTQGICSPQSSWIVLCLHGWQNVRNVLKSNPVLIFVCLLRIGPRSEAHSWRSWGLLSFKLMRNQPTHTMPVKMASSFTCPHWNGLGQGCVLPWWSSTRKHWKRRVPTM